MMFAVISITLSFNEIRGTQCFGKNQTPQFISGYFVRFLFLYWDTNSIYGCLKHRIDFDKLFPDALPSSSTLEPQLFLPCHTMIAFSILLSVSIPFFLSFFSTLSTLPFARTSIYFYLHLFVFHLTPSRNMCFHIYPHL